MEQSRKNLKIASIVVLVFAGFSLLELVGELLFGDLNQAAIPEGAGDNILMITKIILIVVGLLCTIPQVYIGLKGLKVAKNPDSSRGHIIWGIILLAISAFGLISSLVEVFKQGNTFEDISGVLSIVVEVCIFFEYVKYAKDVADGK